MYRLEDIYQERYQVSLIGNQERIKEVGTKIWLQEQQELYTCPECGLQTITESVENQIIERINEITGTGKE